jgi:hypothetical protein
MLVSCPGYIISQNNTTREHIRGDRSAASQCALDPRGNIQVRLSGHDENIQQSSTIKVGTGMLKHVVFNLWGTGKMFDVHYSAKQMVGTHCLLYTREKV